MIAKRMDRGHRKRFTVHRNRLGTDLEGTVKASSTFPFHVEMVSLSVT